MLELPSAPAPASAPNSATGAPPARPAGKDFVGFQSSLRGALAASDAQHSTRATETEAKPRPKAATSLARQGKEAPAASSPSPGSAERDEARREARNDKDTAALPREVPDEAGSMRPELADTGPVTDFVAQGAPTSPAPATATTNLQGWGGQSLSSGGEQDAPRNAVAPALPHMTMQPPFAGQQGVLVQEAPPPGALGNALAFGGVPTSSSHSVTTVNQELAGHAQANGPQDVPLQASFQDTVLADAFNAPPSAQALAPLVSPDQGVGVGMPDGKAGLGALGSQANPGQSVSGNGLHAEHKPASSDPQTVMSALAAVAPQVAAQISKDTSGPANSRLPSATAPMGAPEAAKSSMPSLLLAQAFSTGDAPQDAQPGLPEAAARLIGLEGAPTIITRQVVGNDSQNIPGQGFGFAVPDSSAQRTDAPPPSIASREPSAPPPPVRQLAPVLVSLAFGGGNETLTIALDPGELGRVEVSIGQGKDAGQVRIMAERPETLALLQRDQRELDRALNQAGLGDMARSLSFSLASDQGRQQHQHAAQDGANRFAALAAGQEAEDMPIPAMPAPPRASTSLVDLAV